MSAPAYERPDDYARWRAQHTTELRRHAPAPNAFEPIVRPPAGVEAVHYVSQGRALKAWLMRPEHATRAPGLVYLHGNFELEAESFGHVRRFVEAGFAVLLPTYRGEQGNPGHLELLYGEVDDAAAAVRWLGARPDVDERRIYAIGHSVGGAISALLSLLPDLPLRETASVGGIYVPETFVRWRRMPGNRALVRFDPGDRAEREIRVLGPNLHSMRRPHVAYVGNDDWWFIRNAKAVERQARWLGKPFEVVRVPGDHMTSLIPALERYLHRLDATGADAPGSGGRGRAVTGR